MFGVEVYSAALPSASYKRKKYSYKRKTIQALTLTLVPGNSLYEEQYLISCLHGPQSLYPLRMNFIYKFYLMCAG